MNGATIAFVAALIVILFIAAQTPVQVSNNPNRPIITTPTRSDPVYTGPTFCGATPYTGRSPESNPQRLWNWSQQVPAAIPTRLFTLVDSPTPILQFTNPFATTVRITAVDGHIAVNPGETIQFEPIEKPGTDICVVIILFQENSSVQGWVYLKNWTDGSEHKVLQASADTNEIGAVLREQGYPF